MKPLKFQNGGEIGIEECTKDNATPEEISVLIRLTIKRGGIQALIDLTETEAQELSKALNGYVK